MIRIHHALLVLTCLLSPLAMADAVQDEIRARFADVQDRELTASAAGLPQAMAQFYAARDWAPVWDEARLTGLVEQLSALYTDGLDPQVYGVGLLQREPVVGESPAQKAERDLIATRGYLLALLHLVKGKADPARLDAHWNFEGSPLEPLSGLAAAREAAEKNALPTIFQRARPARPQYNALRSALARYRVMELEGGWKTLPAGSPLKPGMRDVRVPLLRERLQVAGLLGLDVPADPWRYDDALKAAVMRFQAESYLSSDGVVGPGTLAVLNIPVSVRIDQIRANLERLRWFRQETAGDAVIVDLAGYRIAYVRDGKTLWRSEVQIGKEYRATPVFRSEISHLTLSPGWVVPPTIFREDALPAIRRNPDYLSRQRMKVFNAMGQEIPASAVNWRNPGNITLRQQPGADGALGELVIRFDNLYSIYLHDTPHKSLFAASQRATSSGCIRVQNIHELAVLLLDDPAKWSREGLQSAINERVTRNVKLTRKIPILLAYWTVDVGADGYVSFKPDVYKQDVALVAALDAPTELAPLL
ncbi:MAG: L,D-transpeptidase family protein [Moraxellaceae bacterium]|nr:L,D-transpeptidase family protein [Moraxellaceae bacterium]